MESMFVKDLKKKAKSKFESHDGTALGEAGGLLDSYRNIVAYNNVIISVICQLLGAISFVLMGYLAMIWIKNSHFYFGEFISLLISGIAVSYILWGVRSVVSYAIWKGIIKKDYEPECFFYFFTLEGVSEIAFAVVVPFFFLFGIISTYFATLCIGAGMALKYLLMWFTYDVFVDQCSNADRALLVASSIGSVIMLGVFVKFFILGI